MSRKHFIRLAAAIAALASSREREQMCSTIGHVCAESNDLFCWSRWTAACNVLED